MMSVVARSGLIASLLGSGMAVTNVVRAQQAQSEVIVAPVIEREVKSFHRAVGTVMPRRTSIVGSAVDGRVLEFPIEAGDRVEQGQVLAQLRTTTLEIELAAARAELTLRKHELDELKNGSRDEDKREALAKELAAKIVSDNAARKLKRALTLLERGVINQEEVDDLQESADAAEQLRRAAEAARQRVETGPRAETILQATARWALQQEQVALIEERKERFTIRAPFDGYVAVERTQVGEWLQSGDPVAEIIQLDTVKVLANVPAAHVNQLVLGERVDVEISDLPGTVSTGVIERIIPSADVQTRTFPVSILIENRIENESPQLKAGMLTRVVLPTGDRQLTLVPKDALVLEGRKASVWIVQPDAENRDTGTVRKLSVDPGESHGAFTAVTALLSEGDLLVIRGNERLKPSRDADAPPQAVSILERRTIDEDFVLALPTNP
jgi:multidrug efflux pump subunit AcrA (membrane-fusion protein)